MALPPPLKPPPLSYYTWKTKKDILGSKKNLNVVSYLLQVLFMLQQKAVCPTVQTNEIGSESDTYCSIIEAEDAYNINDGYIVKNPEVIPKRINYIYPPLNQKNWSAERRLSVSLRPESSVFYTAETDDDRNTSSEFDTLEKHISKDDALIAFSTISPIIPPVTITATTIEGATWTYQGIRSNEESYESKSTLIDYPFSVSLQRKGAHYTTGALLDKLWIITSAGDFYNVRESLKLFRARLGSVDCKRGGVVIPIKKIEIHPYYLEGKPNFDVALLRMAYDVQFTDYIRPIAISKINGKLIRAKFMTTYWPRILHKGLTLPFSAKERIKYNSMRVSLQHLIPDHMCSKIMANFSLTLNEASLCLKPVITHHSVCKPDPGAPVVAEDGLCGITSGWISPKCPQMAAPTLFTRISSPSVRFWLDKELLSL